MTWTSAITGSVSVIISSSNVMSGICACWRSVSVEGASSSVFFPPVGVHTFAVSISGLYCADNPFRWDVTFVVCSMAMLELMPKSWVSVEVRLLRLASLDAYAAETESGR